MWVFTELRSSPKAREQIACENPTKVGRGCAPAAFSAKTAPHHQI
jgi:hypothetical protein